MAGDTTRFLLARKTAATLYFPLATWSATDPSDDFGTGFVHVAGDTKISKDGGAFVNTTNAFAHLGLGIYSLALTAAEMDAAEILVAVEDAAAKAYKDRLLHIETRRIDGPVATGTAQAGGAASITLESGASASDDFFNGNLISIISGTGAGQTRVIRDYVGATKVATVGRAWITAPGVSSVYSIRPGGDVELDPYGVDDIWDEVEGAEPASASDLPANSTMRRILQFFKRWAFNRGTATNAARTVYKDDSVTTLTTQTFTNDGVTQDRGKVA